MSIMILGISILIFTLGHILKTSRLEQFIEIYEKPKEKVLLRSLVISNIINLVLPFRIGNIFRIYLNGKEMKNSYSFSMATIIIDIIMDFFAIVTIYWILYICNQSVTSNLIAYTVICLIIIIGIILCKICEKNIKKIIYKIASIFNTKIEFKILKISLYTLETFNNIFRKVNKRSLIIYTVLVWISYTLSIYMFSLYISSIGQEIYWGNLFNRFFGINSLIKPLFSFNVENLLLIVFVVVPLILTFILSKIVIENKKEERVYLELLPYVNVNDKLMFLEQYFGNPDENNYYKKYLELNNDISIIEDHSAGSNATTMLCSKNGKLFYRKYSYGKDSKKLSEQIKWIKNHENDIPLTKILNTYETNTCVYYDMPYILQAKTCFTYVHTNSIEDSWNIIKNVLDKVSSNLHTKNIHNSEKEKIECYIDEKVIKNINIVKKANQFKEIVKYEKIKINGIYYKNLINIEKYLTKEHLGKIFKNDICSDIHGDFTIENIICLEKKDENYKENFYIIDPNTGNIHNSSNLDYAKLLQSIHGGYEFLMNTPKVEFGKNYINFIFSKSEMYQKLYKKYEEYLAEKFNFEQLKSIYYHEIVHWLRLLPYKIEKNGDRALLFYAGFIIIANDIIDRFEGEKDER